MLERVNPDDDKGWLRREIESARQRLAERPDWVKRIDYFVGVDHADNDPC